MSSKIFEGSVSIVKNTKGLIALKKDAEGRFNAGNVDELKATMLKLAKEHKTTIDQWSLWLKDPKGEAVLLARMPYGTPYVAVLPKQADKPVAAKKSVTKLA
jgi:hypothetical protein